MALGARAGHIVGRTVGAGVRLALLGVALGLALALPASRFVSEFLFQVEPTDPLIYGSIAITVSVVSALAAYLPARRAAAVNPVAALTDA
jgi:ABC-type antimicrobial peptide transport system permease subunit